MKLEKRFEEHNTTEFATPGVSRRLDLDRAAEEHLKPNSGELEVIQKLKQVLRITRVGHHYMDQSSLYQFCLGQAEGCTGNAAALVHGIVTDPVAVGDQGAAFINI